MRHLWKLYSGLHFINMISLCTSMLIMYQYIEGIPEYINALKDTKKQPKGAVPTTPSPIMTWCS